MQAPQPDTPFYVAIEGVIGAGKTTLARMLGQTLDASTLLEIVEENAFLQNFYSDRARYAFQTETFFLLSRYRQQQAVVQPTIQHTRLISDYLFVKNRIFASLNLAGDEWNLFLDLYNALSERVPKPDLVVFLQASVDTLLGRIAQRDRSFERNMDQGYITAVRDAYEQFFADYNETPLLMIETDERDIVRDLQARTETIGMIRAALQGYHQQALIP